MSISVAKWYGVVEAIVPTQHLCGWVGGLKRAGWLDFGDLMRDEESD